MLINSKFNDEVLPDCKTGKNGSKGFAKKNVNFRQKTGFKN